MPHRVKRMRMGMRRVSPTWINNPSKNIRVSTEKLSKKQLVSEISKHAVFTKLTTKDKRRLMKEPIRSLQNRLEFFKRRARGL